LKFRSRKWSIAALKNKRSQLPSYAPNFERAEGFLQTAAGVRSPKVMIEIRILPRWLVDHRCRMVTPCGHLEMSSL
jgi:hypothetical protein